jgi:hypothetical protein
VYGARVQRALANTDERNGDAEHVMQSMIAKEERHDVE